MKGSSLPDKGWPSHGTKFAPGMSNHLGGPVEPSKGGASCYDPLERHRESQNRVDYPVLALVVVSPARTRLAGKREDRSAAWCSRAGRSGGFGHRRLDVGVRRGLAKRVDYGVPRSAVVPG